MPHSLRIPDIPTADWSAANHTGRERASGLIAEARRTGNPMPLCRALGDIVGRGEYGAVEVGFIHKVAVSTL